MSIGHSLLFIAPYAYGVGVTVVLCIVIGTRHIAITIKNLLKAVTCYSPIFVMAFLITIIIPNNEIGTPIKITTYFLPLFWIGALHMVWNWIAKPQNCH
jgi:hypothetical protein